MVRDLGEGDDPLVGASRDEGAERTLRLDDDGPASNGRDVLDMTERELLRLRHIDLEKLLLV